MTETQPGCEGGLPREEAAAAAAREERIAEALTKAWRTGHPIDDWTAKHIARALDPGDGALHEFAETGAIPAGIEADLVAAREVARDLESDGDFPRIIALAEYLAGRLVKTEMPYWNDESME